MRQLFDLRFRREEAARPRAVETLTGHLLGITILAAGAGMFVSTIIEAVDAESNVPELFALSIGCFAVGLALWRSTAVPERLRRGQVFLAVTTAWVVFALVATLPFFVTDSITRFDDALFETISGFTTTGSTILTDVGSLTRGVLFWRSMTQWYGGIGIIVLAVSVLPVFTVGGIGLLEAEAPGPTAERLAPRVRETARLLTFLYLGFTATVVVGYLVGGMSPYDAFAFAFTTVSTGGFAPYNDSFAHFDSAFLEWFAFVAMLVAGGSFALYYGALRGRLHDLLRSTEARTYVGIILFAVAFCVVWNGPTLGFGATQVRQVAFTVMSIGSSTGYGLLDYDLWVGATQLLLLFLMALGGMAGSTTGGFKTIRLLGAVGYGRREVAKQVNPNLVRVVKIGHQPIDEDVTKRIVGFLALFIVVGAVGSLLVAASGTDPLTAISSVAQALGNVGPGLGRVGPTQTFLNIPAPGRGVLMVVMLMGRLEIFPVILAVVALGQARRRVAAHRRRARIPTSYRPNARVR